MNKIGILTFHWADNYGAVLQAYALRKYLSQNGYNVEVVNYNCKYPARIYEPFYFQANNIKQSVKGLLRCAYNFPTWIMKRWVFNKFRDKIGISQHEYSKRELLAEQYDYDVLIAGSDQIWNTEIVGEGINIYSLSFAQKASAISYAASSGKLDVQHNKIHRTLVDEIAQLSAISVRERSTKKYLEKNIEKKVFLSVDPTMLLTRTEWNQLAESVHGLDERYLLVYCISYDESLISTARKISEEKNLKIVVCGKIKELKGEAVQFTHAAPEQFLNLIKNATFIVATSYHATVFSTIFQKQFVVLLPSYASNRVSDFCESIGLSSRCIHDASEVDVLLNQEIVYGEILQKEAAIVNESKYYLQRALEDTRFERK